MKERLARKLTREELRVITELYSRKRAGIPTKGYVTTVEPVPVWRNDDDDKDGPHPETPSKTYPAGSTLQIVMISRFGDFGLTDDLDCDYGYDARLDFNDAAITDIRLTRNPITRTA